MNLDLGTSLKLLHNLARNQAQNEIEKLNQKRRFAMQMNVAWPRLALVLVRALAIYIHCELHVCVCLPSCPTAHFDYRNGYRSRGLSAPLCAFQLLQMFMACAYPFHTVAKGYM